MTDSHEGEGSALTADDLRRLGLNPRSQPAYLIEGEVFDSRVTVEELQAVLRADPINGLREVIAIDQNGEIGHPFP